MSRSREGDALYTPPADAPGAGAMYPRVERLLHDDADGETLLATFEHYASADPDCADPFAEEFDGTVPEDQPYFPIYRSTDGGETWDAFSAIRDTENDWGLRYQPVLFELPEAVGPWGAGTVLAAGNSLPDDRSRTSIDVYASEDGGRSWSYVSTVAEGGRAVPQADETPVWEPELALDADRELVCYFADERHREDGYDQLVGHRRSVDGGRTWEDEVFDAVVPNGEDRPGMPVVTRLPDGRYVLTFEVVGPTHEGGLFVKTSPDGRDWGDPEDLGSPVETAEGHRLTNGPYVTWTPGGVGDEAGAATSADGAVVASAKTLRTDGDEQAPGSGRTLLATTDFEDFADWEPVAAPLSFADEFDTGQRTVGWTTPLLPSADGEELLQMTSTHVADGRCEIRYASAPLDLS
ncbi:sialidase family protein [Halosimplex pelagicum]|uniref:Exo-alpha-sialidase n=1 Tax=Halosimplex pelagicum TaxID=869886 RepID=A0A7D5TV33_9EURY|nr:sialidase family protein [Halosimplex pelagicum]QLH82894.1 exo-alpha-sialidase [Halosimplex pelagicum]